MKSKYKRIIRSVSAKSKLLNWVYTNASNIKTKHLKKVSDEEFLIKRFKENTGRDLNLEAPRTFNEKLQWIKLYDHNPLYTKLVDKYKVREFVAETIGEEYLNDLLGVYESYDDIDFNELPDQFVLKCTHDCGSIIICKDKAQFDKEKAKHVLTKALKNNYFWVGREWPYKNVHPRIICERFLKDKSSEELTDYKFYCFNGTPKMLLIITERGKSTKGNYYDMDFKPLPFTQEYPRSHKIINKPKNFELMKDLASKLADGIPEVRVDFYEVNGKVIFGEMTFFDSGGMAGFDPPEWDSIIGSWFTLPMKESEKRNEIER